MSAVSTYEFGPITVSYDDRVLRPRAWTLVQSDWAVDLSPHVPDGAILELCAGAGQIGLAAAVSTGRGLVQVEAEEAAAGFARRNAAAIGCDDIDVRCAAMANALRRHETFPLILADPPYVRSDDIAMFPEDPPRAIDGGADGLDSIRTCLYVIREHLARSGACLLQVRGEAQAREVAQLARAGAPRLRLVSTQHVDEQRAVMHLIHAEV